MNKLDARDRRRAEKIMSDKRIYLGGAALSKEWMENWTGVRNLIAAALKKERQDSGMAAMQFFLFSNRNDREKAKRAIKRGAKASA
jgi:hypothetical protein